MTTPHDPPTAAQLVESVREWLENHVMPEASGALQFNARVAANVLAMVEREINLGPGQRAAHEAGLARMGCTDDADLALRIRSGEFCDDDGRVRVDVEEFVFDSIVDKLKVANPKYLR